MKDSSYIGGLMAEMTNNVQQGCFSLIPFSTIEHQYIRNSRYILQRDRRGRVVGYILHGALKPGRPLHLTQVAIEYDLWERGHGLDAVRELLRRADGAMSSSIILRCALDLPAISFWNNLGFRTHSVVPGGKRRNREIVVMRLPLPPGLFSQTTHKRTHDHTCSCGTATETPHEIGTKGCKRFMAPERGFLLGNDILNGTRWQPSAGSVRRTSRPAHQQGGGDDGVE